MTVTLTACARVATSTLRHHGVEMHPDDIRGLVIDVFTALAENVSEEMVEAGHGALWVLKEINAQPDELNAAFTAMIRAAVGERG